MADKIAKRGISIYIDGKEVKNSVNGIKAEMNKLTAEQKKMTIGSDEYMAHAKKIAYLDSLFQEHKANQKAVAAEYKKMGVEADSYAKKSESSISKMANGINKYFAMFTAGLAAVTGLTLGLKKFMDERNKVEDSKADLKALTGLDDASVNKLTGFAKKMSENPIEGTKIRIKASVAEILEAYKLVGSAKPELLKDAEALNEVTKQSMILSQAAGMPLADAVHGTVIALNQYSAGADQAAKYVNILAAGSQAGAQEVPYITEALVKFGAVAKLANVPFEQSVALIEAVGEKGFQAEVAGTGIKTFFTKLLQGANDTNPAIVGMHTALENLNKKFSGKGGFSEMTKLFGQDNVVVAQTLIANRARFDELSTAVSGTNSAIDQATITSATNSAKMAQAQNKFMNLGMELVKNLNPAMLKATNIGNAFMKFFVELPKWINENKGLLIALSGAMSVYAMWLGVLSLAEKKLSIEKAISTTLTKGRIVADLAWCAVQQTLAGNLKTAQKAMKALNAEMNGNAYIAIGVIIAALTVGIYKLVTAQSAANKAYHDFNVQSAIETSTANQLFEAAKKNIGNKEEHKRIIDKINSVYGQYLGNQLTEKSNLDEIARAQMQVNIALRDKIAIETKETAKADVTKEYVKQQVDLADELRNNISKSKGEDLSGIFMEEIQKILEENSSDLEKGYKMASEKLKIQMGSDLRPGHLMSLRAYAVSVSKMNKDLSDIDRKFQGFEAKKDMVIYDPTKPKKKVEPTDTSNNFGPGNDDKSAEQKKKVDEAMQGLENDNIKALTAIKLSYLKGDIKTEYDYNKALLDQQDNYDSLRKEKLTELLKTVTDPGVKLELNKQLVEIDKKALDRQIKQNNDIKKILLDADPIESERQAYDNRLRELGLFGVDKKNMTADQLEALRILEEQHNETIRKLSTKEAVSKLKQLERDQEKEESELANRRVSEKMSEQTFKDELLAIEVKFLKKKLAIQGLSADEIDKITKKLTQSTIDSSSNELNKYLSFKSKFGLQELTDFKTQKEAELIILKDFLDKGLLAEKDAAKVRAILASEEFRTETKGAKETAQVIADISGNFSNAFQGFQRAEEKSVETKYQKQIDAAKKAGKDTTKLEDKKSKELAAIRAKNADSAFALQVAMITASTAMAAIDAYANALKIPVVGLALAPIAAGAAVAYGLAQLAEANSAREAAKEGYFFGGFTGGDDPKKVRGYFPDGSPYHGKEFVATHVATANPNLLPAFDLIDEAQKNGTVSSLTKSDLAKALNINSTVDTPTRTRTAVAGGNPNAPDNPIWAAMINRQAEVIEKLNKRLDEPFEAYSVISGKKGSYEQTKRYEKLIKNASR